MQALVVERSNLLAAVLAGSKRSLQHARIDAVHFRALGGERATMALGRLLQADYSVFRVNGPSVLREVGPNEALEAGQHLALNNRLRPLFFGRRTTGLDLVGLLAQHGLQIHGVLHVGAHEGQEISTYDRLGVRHVTFVEANPDVHARLCKAMAGRDHVRCMHRAISDTHGTIRLNLASFDQSSSILPMAGHLEIYPEIVPAGSVEVPCTTIDGLIAECGGSFDMFDLLHLDIQGAEGLALRGARQALRHLDAVHVEVNFSNLYEHGAQIEEIEDLLHNAGFRRVALLCPFHPSWGDALYVRTNADLP